MQNGLYIHVNISEEGFSFRLSCLIARKRSLANILVFENDFLLERFFLTLLRLQKQEKQLNWGTHWVAEQRSLLVSKNAIHCPDHPLLHHDFVRL